MKTILAMAAMTEAFEDDVKNGLRKESHRLVSKFLRFPSFLSYLAGGTDKVNLFEGDLMGLFYLM